ncbi:MAG: ThiF family adenylyltransferase, partial [Tissierellia bacterium]|nr:ThiF family adenylyltransferase [Tissierellia bacterium]
MTIKYEKFSQIQKAFLKCLIDNNLIINNQSNSQQMKYLNFKRQIEYFDSWSLSCESSCLAQSILNSSSICIIGAGGVGTALSMQFLSCGIGKIYLIDDDIIEESNLARQFLFSKSEIGRKKVEIISDKLNKRGLGTVVPIDNKISIHNIEDLIEMMPNVEIITGVPTPHSKNDYILLREMIKYGKAVICSDE